MRRRKVPGCLLTITVGVVGLIGFYYAFLDNAVPVDVNSYSKRISNIVLAGDGKTVFNNYRIGSTAIVRFTIDQGKPGEKYVECSWRVKQEEVYINLSDKPPLCGKYPEDIIVKVRRK